MAEVTIKNATVDRVFYDNKALSIVEKFKTKTGEGSQRYTIWFTAPHAIAVGDVVSVTGLLGNKIAEFMGNDGNQKQIVELSVNNAVLAGQAISAPPAPPALEDLPF